MCKASDAPVLADTNYTSALKVPMYPCSTEVPDNGIIEGYTKLTNASCTFCAEMCKAPTIDSSIGFFDGFKGRTVTIVYIVFLTLTVFY